MEGQRRAASGGVRWRSRLGVVVEVMSGRGLVGEAVEEEGPVLGGARI
jgi:hypothetical protein